MITLVRTMNKASRNILMYAVGIYFAQVFMATEAHTVYKREQSKCPNCQSSTCAAKFEALPGHTACLSKSPNAKSWDMTDAIKQSIVDQHNSLRASVKPPAANMLKMSWDNEIAMIAQHWSDACQKQSGKYFHDPVRGIPGRFGLGQNIGNGFPSFTEVTKAWFDEDKDYAPYFGQKLTSFPPGKMIGHYTQLVWADSGLIGCGATTCGSENFFVCNYGPLGNVMPFSSPYLPGNQMGEKCKTKTPQGLCDCNGVVCENMSTMNASTCTCKCDYDSARVGPTCKLSCQVPTAFYCNVQPGFMPTFCPQPYMQAACPNVCGLCPCSDPTFIPTYCPGAGPQNPQSGPQSQTQGPQLQGPQSQGPQSRGSQPQGTQLTLTTLPGPSASETVTASPPGNSASGVIFSLPLSFTAYIVEVMAVNIPFLVIVCFI